MDLSWMTMRDLQYVLAVSEHRHFGKAARACHVSQPGLSAQIQKVENQLNVRLFERSKRQVELTPAGIAVAQQARTVLEEAHRIGEIALGHKDPLSGVLRVGAIATLGPYLIPHLLSPIKKKFPKLDLFFREGLTDTLLAELKDGKLDLILASPTFDETGFRVLPLFLEPFWVATPQGHPFSKKRVVQIKDLSARDMVLLEDGNCLKDQTLDLCTPGRRGGVRRFHATSLETLRHLVASGHGYTLIPQLALRKDLGLDQMLCYRPFDQKSVGRVIALICRERYARMEDAELLAEFIQTQRPPGMVAV